MAKKITALSAEMLDPEAVNTPPAHAVIAPQSKAEASLETRVAISAKLAPELYTSLKLHGVNHRISVQDMVVEALIRFLSEK